MPRPTITTARLVLRPFVPADAPAIQRLASDRAIAASTLLIPHPYPEGAAAEWIAGHDDTSNNHIFAITLRDGGEAMGAIGLHVDTNHDRAEIGYWRRGPHWHRGYGSEAAKAIVDYVFNTPRPNRRFSFPFT